MTGIFKFLSDEKGISDRLFFILFENKIIHCGFYFLKLEINIF